MMIGKRSNRIVAAVLTTLALTAVQSTAASAQYEKGCQYYAVNSCAGDKYIALGFSTRSECYQAKRLECENGGPLDFAQFKAEPTTVLRAPAAHS